MATLFIDLDGTLTDPTVGITRCIQFALEELGRQAPEADELTWCIGPPLLGSFETLLGNTGDAEKALRLYRERFSDTGLFENSVYDGIRDALADLAAADHRMLVATSKPTVYAKRIIDHFNLTRFFDDVFGSELNGTRTDKTELLAWIIAQKQLQPSNTIMIGDRRHDVIGARNNALRSVGVLYGYGSREELAQAGAEEFCDQPHNLPAVIAAMQ